MPHPDEHTDGPTAEPTRTVLAELYRRPVQIRRPTAQRVPIVLAFPHSGRCYPDSFLAASALTPPLLRRSEDAYADLLFEGAADSVPTLAARFPRAFVDVNRRPSEIDPTMFDDVLPGPIEASAHVAAGFGVIARIVREGAVINRGNLSPLDAMERIEKLHRPYHCALAELMAETRDRFGFAILIDCHTMPGAPGVADIVLGDRFGTAAPSRLVGRVEKSFAAQGFSVGRNVPFAGGHCTALYARADDGYFALQIEVHRPLYMNEEQVALSDRFPQVQARIAAAMRSVLAADIAALCAMPPRRSLAAE